MLQMAENKLPLGTVLGQAKRLLRSRADFVTFFVSLELINKTNYEKNPFACCVCSVIPLPG